LTLSSALGHVTAMMVEETSQHSQQVDSRVLTAVIWREKQDMLLLTNIHHPPADMVHSDRDGEW
jgi:hypothetical protein